MRTHNFGTCNFTAYHSHKYPDKIVRSCGLDPKTCSKDCKRYVDEMNSQRCRKGFEKKVTDGEMWSTSNKTALAVWKAINVCSTTTEIKGTATTMQPLAVLVIAFALLCVLSGFTG